MQTIIRKPRVAEKTGCSGRTIDRLEANGEFPQRVQLGVNSVGWYESEVDEWIDTRPRGCVAAPDKAIEARKANRAAADAA